MTNRCDSLALPAVPDAAPSTHRWRDRIVVVLFFVALATPGIALFWTASRSTTMFENRAAAPWPAYLTDGFTRAFEAAFADRFGGRDLLIQLHHRAKASIFGVSPVDKVVIGRDGWLYYANEDGRDFERRRKASTADEVAAVADGIARRVRYLSARGIRYVLVVVPDKHTLYPEHLPPAYARAPDRTVLDALLDKLSSTAVDVVDLRGPLRAAKPSRQLYWATDSHWNFSGGWIGYGEIVAAMRRELALRAEPVPALSAAFAQGVISGDLVTMIGVPGLRTEPHMVLQMPPSWVDCARDETGSPPRWDLLRQILHCPAAPLGRADIYHDSMGLVLKSFLPHQLRQSRWFHQRQWDLALLAESPPDIVIDEIVERNLRVMADAAFLDTAPAEATRSAR